MPVSKNSPAVLITAAAPSADQQLDRRRRKYVVMMACRVPFLILAGVTAHIWWLALLFLAVSVPLPWIAVLIANEAPVRKDENAHRLDRAGRAQLSAAQLDHRLGQ
ncbi:DUF3099 domain-containing protein [Amycolatopsis sp. NPDC004169]|uniref:DUF3099 domain-containing protein n=1 Tax=Amycolatopsis sp. NPDC004169 TaxID=3154453 RepID=UPI0033A3E30A